MDWNFTGRDIDYSAKTFRTSFSETVLADRLSATFRRIHKDENGQEWLDDLTLERFVLWPNATRENRVSSPRD